NRDIPFAKSLIDYIFCWLGCQFIPGYADRNVPNRAATANAPENKTTTTARQLVEKTKDLAHKIAEAKAAGNNGRKKTAKRPGSNGDGPGRQAARTPVPQANALADAPSRIGSLIGTAVPQAQGALQVDAAVMEQFNAQFTHFGDDAPACDVCGAITVRNGTCYKCFNCGNSMGCS
ncbi:MAG: hypothetical protein JW741_22835, partial [Sedimentisphaerales bacterium]|nr:hypothetical protein [Sedimentisphaerales bacterium]